jgi:hypothetical protein
MDFIEKPFVFYRFMRAFRVVYLFIEIRHHTSDNVSLFAPNFIPPQYSKPFSGFDGQT